MGGEVPDLFGRVPAGLFAPLSGTHAALYWPILALFYQLEFEREPTFLIREVAIDLAAEIVRGSALWQEGRDELLALDNDQTATEHALDEAAQVRAVARRLVARLERTRWFHFEYRSTVGHVLAFFPYSARILDTLVRVARDEQPVFQGYAHAIASLLRPESVAARPGVALSESKRQTLEMVRELKILERNIYAFTQRLLDEISTAVGILEEGVERYRTAVLGNYHRLKTVYNLFKWRGEILHRLDGLEGNSLFLDGATAWYSEQLGLDAQHAADAVTGDLRVLRSQFESLPDILEDIDTRNARFSGVALRKLMYLLRHDKRMEGQLQLVVDRLAKDEAPDDLEFDVYRCELLGDEFLYTPPRARARPEPQELRTVEVSDADIRTVIPRLRRRFSRARVEAFVEEIVGGRGHVRFEEIALRTDEDYVRAIYVAAYGVDGQSSYRFEPDEQAAQASGARFRVPSGRIVTKRRGR